jgi:gliding motility associated protien GldN
MKNALKLFNLIVLVFIGLNAYSQAEEIITESSDPEENIYIDDIVAKRLILEKRVIPYEPVREADIAWEKRIWRIIDTREKINLPFRYPEKPFFSILQELADNGEIKVFHDDKFTEELTPEEILDKLNRVDTAVIYDPDTYEEQIKITTSIINPEDINRYRVKEIWYFDEESSTLKVRIMGIAPIKEEYDDETGAFKYEAPLFWVYYPEIREPLSKQRVFNEFNDMAPMTWYDLFEARFFSSYIYKASNVLDLRLKDIYADNGIDRLLESEKIKAELFNFEHDLWEY